MTNNPRISPRWLLGLNQRFPGGPRNQLGCAVIPVLVGEKKKDEPAKPEAPNRLSPLELKIDLKERSIDGDAEVSMTAGFLELMACIREPKEHESIVGNQINARIKMTTNPYPSCRRLWRNFWYAWLIGIVGFDSIAAAERPGEIKPGQVWLDAAGNRINAHGGCVIFHEGLYYWYGEHKIKGLSEAKHADGGVHCYASKDLAEWQDMGMMIRLDRPENEDLTHECNSDRPKVVYNEKTREFVMFFKLYLRGMGTRVAFVGVATSQSPTGPFIYRHKFLGGNSTQGTGDFAMFKDDDGSLYHLGVRKPDKDFVIGKMRDDYLLPEGTYEVCEGITKGTEGPAVFKNGGVYFMLASGSSGWNPNTARQFSAKSLSGSWKPEGNPVSGTNPHNGLGADLTFGGQSNFVLKVEGKENAFIAMFDINKPDHPYESGYIWLPITLNGSKMAIPWQDSWTPDDFK